MGAEVSVCFEINTDYDYIYYKYFSWELQMSARLLFFITVFALLNIKTKRNR
jgi:hypothetical protein